MDGINMGDITRNTFSQDICALSLKQCEIRNHATVITVIYIFLHSSFYKIKRA